MVRRGENGRELYEAVRFAAKEAQRNGASVPFYRLISMIEQLLEI